MDNLEARGIMEITEKTDGTLVGLPRDMEPWHLVRTTHMGKQKKKSYALNIPMLKPKIRRM